MFLYDFKYLDQCDTLSLSLFKRKLKRKVFAISSVTKSVEDSGKEETFFVAKVALNLTGKEQKYYGKSSSIRQEIIQPSNTIYFYRFENGKFIIDKFGLVCKPSNLGIGKVWYMVCPYTSKLCRRLYFHNGHFYSRYVFARKRYGIQIMSKKSRIIERMLKVMFSVSDDRFIKKYHKAFYRGKITRSESRIIKKEKKEWSFFSYNKGKYL